MVKRLEGFLDEPLAEALEVREARADLLLAWDDEVVKVVDALKAKGLTVAVPEELRGGAGELPPLQEGGGIRLR